MIMINPDAPVAAPQTGERTGKQQGGNRGDAHDVLNQLGGGGMLASGTNLRVIPLYWSDSTREEMENHPSIALGLAIVYSMILSGRWKIETEEGVPDGLRKAVEEHIVAYRDHVVKECCRAIGWGKRIFEKVWELVPAQYEGLPPQIFVYRKLKTLNNRLSEVVVSDQGALVGVKQDRILLPAEKVFIYTYDKIDDDFNGRPRLLNALLPYNAWRSAQHKSESLQVKAAGHQLVIHYPPGETETSQGKVSNKTIALQLAQAINNGQVAVIDNLFAGEEDMTRAAALAGKSSYVIQYMNPGETGSASDASIDERKYMDQLMLRSLFVPERMAVEASTAGSRADSDNAGDVGVTIADLDHKDITRQVNWYLLNPFVEINAPAYAGKIRLVAIPLDDKQRALFRWVMGILLQNQDLAARLYDILDPLGMLEELGLSKKATAELEDPNNPNPNPNSPKPEDTPPPVNQDLLSTVGALNAVLATVKAYYAGEIEREAGIAYCMTMFNMPKERASALFVESDIVQDPNDQPEPPNPLDPTRPPPPEPE